MLFNPFRAGDLDGLLRLPAALRPALTEQAKAKLEDFRERFVGFQERYFEFLKELDAALGDESRLVQYFFRPKRLN